MAGGAAEPRSTEIAGVTPVGPPTAAEPSLSEAGGRTRTEESLTLERGAVSEARKA